jgi:hypothetical protein
MRREMMMLALTSNHWIVRSSSSTRRTETDPVDLAKGIVDRLVASCDCRVKGNYSLPYAVVADDHLPTEPIACHVGQASLVKHIIHVIDFNYGSLIECRMCSSWSVCARFWTKI